MNLRFDTFKENLVSTLLILIFFIFIGALSIYTGASFMSMLVVNLASIALLVIILKKLEPKYQILFMILYWIKYSLLIFDCVYRKLPLTSADFMVFHEFANELLEQVDNVFQVWIVDSEVDLFIRFIAFIYGIFSNNITQIYFYIFLTSMIVVWGVYLLAFEMTSNKKVSKIVIFILMLMPVQIMYSITYLREMHLQLFLVFAIYFLVKYIKKNRLWYVFGSIFFSMLCSATHSGMIVSVIVVVMTIFLYDSKQKKIRFNLIKLFVLGIGFIILTQTPLWNQIAGRFSDINSLSDVVDKTSSTVVANTTYTTLKAENNLQFILYTPYKAILFALSPLPWHIKGISGFITWVIDAVPKAFILFYVAKYFIFYKPNENSYDAVYKQIFFILLILFYCVYGNGTEAYGTALRHRVKVLPLELILMTTYLSSPHYNGRFKIRYEKEKKC